MYERMLNKHIMPTALEMAVYCGENAELFTLLNDWLSKAHGTIQKVVFPYGNKYGWGIAHKKGQKLICNIFAEDNAFTVMMRLSNKEFDAVYNQVQEYTQEYINHKYPCSDGGWIHYRIICREQLEDIQKLLTVKCT